MRRLLLPRPELTALLALVWLLMQERVSVGNALLGLLLALAIPLFGAPFWPAGPRVRAGGALAAYLGILLLDIVIANLAVARIVLFRSSRDLRPGWLVVPVDLRSAEAITVLAATVSLTPGTLSADVSSDARYLLVHALDVSDEAAAVARIKSRYEARVARIFR